MTIELHTLPNGFRIVTEHMPGLASASVGIWVNAGGRHEAEAQNGIAHFLEHMAFKGTKRRTARGIAEEIEAAMKAAKEKAAEKEAAEAGSTSGESGDGGGR